MPPLGWAGGRGLRLGFSCLGRGPHSPGIIFAILCWHFYELAARQAITRCGCRGSRPHCRRCRPVVYGRLADQFRGPKRGPPRARGRSQDAGIGRWSLCNFWVGHAGARGCLGGAPESGGRSEADGTLLRGFSRALAPLYHTHCDAGNPRARSAFAEGPLGEITRPTDPRGAFG